MTLVSVLLIILGNMSTVYFPYCATLDIYCISMELCLQSDLTVVILIVSPARLFSLKALHPWCLAYSVIQYMCEDMNL